MRDKRTISQEERRRQVHHVGIKARDLLLVPNLLSLSRLLFAVPAVYLIAISQSTRTDLYAGGLLVLSFLSDVLDGIWARTFNAISDLGKILDPLIDKIVMISTAAALTFTQHDPQLPVWLLAGILLRDVLIVVFATLVLAEDHHLFVSSWTGKATTFVLAVTLLAYLLKGFIPTTILVVLPWIGLTMLVLSSIDYLEKYWSVKHKRYMDSSNEAEKKPS